MTLLTTKEVQDLFKVDKSTIYRMAEDGRIPAVKVGRQWRFPSDKLDSLLGGATHLPPRTPSAPPAGREFSLEMALPAETAQALADLAADLFGVMAVVTDMEGNALTTVANPCGYFTTVFGDVYTADRCIEGWRRLGEEIDLEPRFIPSHLGFLCARSFIRQGSKLAGMVIVGGVAPKTWPPSDAEIGVLAEETGVTEATIRGAVNDVYWIDDAHQSWIIRNLIRVSDLISHLASGRIELMAKLERIAALAGADPPTNQQGANVKRLLILGAGTAGTMVANKLRPRLDNREWNITVVDQDEIHYYQPGFLFMPFGAYTRADVERPKKNLLSAGVDLVNAEIDLVEPDKNLVRLQDGSELAYDYLVVATGTAPQPQETPGLDSDEWYKSVFDFYTVDGAEALAAKLETWEGGKLVVNVVEMPIKCPVAPLEFIFLAEAFFADRDMADQVELEYVTPLPGAFTKPVAAKYLGDMLEDRKITLEADFMLERVDADEKKLISYDEREISYDLLVTVPVNMGAAFVQRSGLGDELNHVPVDKHTFLSTDYDNIFAIGDAAALPTSKAGSVAHFAVEIFTENFLNYVAGKPMRGRFDGHANCFIESGRGKGMLIDFNYDQEPLPGKYPLPGIGPFSLLQETEANHWGKLMFKWMYWNILLPGRELPLPALMSMAGKIPEEVA